MGPGQVLLRGGPSEICQVPTGWRHGIGSDRLNPAIGSGLFFFEMVADSWRVGGGNKELGL